MQPKSKPQVRLSALPIVIIGIGILVTIGIVGAVVWRINSVGSSPAVVFIPT